MNPWQVLGLSPTGDLGAIKRAYAEKAKQYHPEEHPEEFQALHEAYRQASRYARQHREEAKPQPAPAPAPAAPPRRAAPDKPSFYTPSEDDNPNQAKRYRSQDDEFTTSQLQDMCKESKRASRAPRRPGPLDLPLPKGKIPIRGAKREPTPAGGLNFSALEQPEAEPEPEPKPAKDKPAALTPLSVPAAPVVPPAARRTDPGRRRASVMLVVFYLVLLPLMLFLPFPASLLLCGAYLYYQEYCDQIRRSWGLTIAEILADVLMFFALDLLLWDFTPSLAASGVPHLIFRAFSFLMPIYRIVRRVRFSRSGD